jgi:hypothetical protein
MTCVERAALLTFVKENALMVLPPAVVTVQVPLVVVPTVTVAVVGVPALAEEVCWMAMVSPGLTPVTGPGTNPVLLMEMPVQPGPQVAVAFVKPPESRTEPGAAPLRTQRTGYTVVLVVADGIPVLKNVAIALVFEFSEDDQ